MKPKLDLWTEKAEEPVLEIIQARRWIEARMREGEILDSPTQCI